MAVASTGASSASAGFGSGVAWTTHAVSGEILVIGASWEGSGGATSATADFGGSAMTAVAAAVGTTFRIRLFYLVNPTAGAATATITLNNSSDGCIGGALSASGVDTGTPLGTFASATGSDTTPTVNVAAAVDDLVIDTVSVGLGQVPGVGGGQLSRWNLQNASASGAGSTEPGAATVTMSWSITGADWAIGAVAIKAAASSDTSTTAQRMAAIGAHVASGGMYGRRWR